MQYRLLSHTSAKNAAERQLGFRQDTMVVATPECELDDIVAIGGRMVASSLTGIVDGGLLEVVDDDGALGDF
jgi:hypothetical protein